MLMVCSGHTFVRSLAKYARVSAWWRSPATRPSMTRLAGGRDSVAGAG